LPGRFDAVEGEPRDVDEPLRCLDPEAHQVDEVRAAAEEPRSGNGRRRDSALRVVRELVGERPQRATSSIAATMLG
jgi:hypothetical protein